MGAGDVEIRILGPIEAVAGARSVRLGGPRSQAVLALLAEAHGRVVSIDRLTSLWGHDPPASVRNQVMIAVNGLRRGLREAGADPGVIETVGSGYRLNGGLVDARLAEESVELGRRAAAEGRAEEAGELYGRALGLWRGPVLAGLDAPDVRAVASRLEELRLTVLEERAELELTLGRHHGLAAELPAPVAEHPLRERLRGQLMLALYRCGRRAEALRVYQDGKRLLADELGLDPGPALRRLEADILADAPAIAAPGDEPEPRPVPAELPPDVRGFTGREHALAWLHDLAPPAGTQDEGASEVRVVAVTGAAGVGKSALAVRAGHRLAARFPDGQLHLDLRGHAAQPPVTPSAALARLLASLGVRPEHIPAEQEAAAALYRSRLSGRRVLVVLDDAHTADQVRPLLPAASGCLVLVTSRDTLTGLVSSHGARLLPLGVLDEAAGLDLLGSIAGHDRVAAEPAHAAELIRLCARLPLALRVAAATLAARPRWSLAEYARAVALDGFDALRIDGDLAVRSALSLSYARQPPPARRLFRLLGLLPGQDVTAEAAAALAGVETAEARRLLDRLAAANLLEERRARRYTFHDLLRLLAKELAERQEEPAARRQALDRLTHWYATSAARAAALAHPFITRLPHGPAYEPALTLDDRAGAAAWLRDEQANLIATAVHAAAYGPRRHAWSLADSLRGHFVLHPAVADCFVTGEAALRAASAEQDEEGLAVAHLTLATAHHLRFDLAEARTGYVGAARHCERAGWARGAAAAHNNAAATCHDLGELHRSIEHFQVALSLSRDGGDRQGEAKALANMGVVEIELGALEAAEERLRRAVELRESMGEAQISVPLGGLATVHRLRGRLAEAAELACEALRSDRAAGSRAGESRSLTVLAEVRRDEGLLDQALDDATRARRLARETHHTYAWCGAANTIGTIHLLGGDYRLSLLAHQEALDHADSAGIQFMRARALIGLGRARLGLGDLDRALNAAGRALEMVCSSDFRLLHGPALSLLSEIHLLQGRRSLAADYDRQVRLVSCSPVARWRLAAV
ncbi:AfsR/SARP family transcriptional regulator [Nonomuraea spiralis]|uniref:AfsR/SARP family transcriptional regulator n=1 Tax=Nonomuraea spiralis TaxID=46182 RepID=UPI0037983320